MRTAWPRSLAAALGPSRTGAARSAPPAALSLEDLRRELQSRLVTRGGRPGLSGRTMRRLLPIRTEMWAELKQHAQYLSRHGRRVSPAQLAALLLEKGVAALRPAG